MDYNELMPGMMLSVQRALLEEISENMRCVSIEGVFENNVHINVYIEGSASEKFKEDMSCIETEVISDFPEIPVKLDIHESTEDKAIKDILRGRAVFWRKE